MLDHLMMNDLGNNVGPWYMEENTSRIKKHLISEKLKNVPINILRTIVLNLFSNENLLKFFCSM